VQHLSKEQYWLVRLRELHNLCTIVLKGRYLLIEASRRIPALLKDVQLDCKIKTDIFIGIDSSTDYLPLGNVRELWQKEALAKLEDEIADSERWAHEIARSEIERILSATGRTMFPATHSDAQTIQAVLGTDFVVVEFLADTKTSADAAAAVGCAVGQIAKSIVFKTVKEQKPVLVIASGTNRVDEKKVSALLGEKVKSADAAFVLAHAGVAPGGVPPVGHILEPTVVLDQDLHQFDEIWAAAGTPNAVFNLTWDDLVALTKGTSADVTKVQPVLP
jgi:prolyl-tRNA editing enzyme YbaK/EbsC (Cys-tRNA(Pro) deacylase)